MAAPRILIHVGCMKTATSTIQTILCEHEDLLFNRHGVLYPSSSRRINRGSTNPFSQAHHLLVHSIRKKNQKEDNKDQNEKTLAERLTELRAEIEARQPRIVVISSELFEDVDVAGKREFVKRLGYPDVGVIMAVRRPDEYVDALFSQLAKNWQTFPDPPRKAVRFRQNIDQWDSVIGPERLQVVYFSKAHVAAYFEDFFRRIIGKPDFSLAAEGISTDIHDNPSMTQMGWLLRQAAKIRLGHATEAYSSRQVNGVNLYLDKAERDLPRTPAVRFLTPAQRQDILDRTREDTMKVRARLSAEQQTWLDEDLERPVSAQGTEQYPGIDPETLTALNQILSNGPLSRRRLVEAAEQAPSGGTAKSGARSFLSLLRRLFSR